MKAAVSVAAFVALILVAAEVTPVAVPFASGVDMVYAYDAFEPLQHPLPYIEPYPRGTKEFAVGW